MKIILKGIFFMGTESFGFMKTGKIYLKLITSWDGISFGKRQHHFTVWEQI